LALGDKVEFTSIVGAGVPGTEAVSNMPVVLKPSGDPLATGTAGGNRMERVRGANTLGRIRVAGLGPEAIAGELMSGTDALGRIAGTGAVADAEINKDTKASGNKRCSSEVLVSGAGDRMTGGV